MVTIDRRILDEMTYRSFQTKIIKGVYTFTLRDAAEGIIVCDDVDNNCVAVHSFAFIDGERIYGEAASTCIARALWYLVDELGLNTDKSPTEAENAPVLVESEHVNECISMLPYGDLTIAEAAIQNHPGSIPVLLGLQHTHKDLVKHLPKSGKPAYVEGHTMIREANLAFLFNWDNEVVDVREDDFEISAMVKCTFRFTEGFTVVKTQCGQADKKFSKTLKTDGNPRLILIGDTIKAATTDGIKKCMSELGINQDVYSGEWSKNDKK